MILFSFSAHATRLQDFGSRGAFKPVHVTDVVKPHKHIAMLEALGGDRALQGLGSGKFG